MGKIAFFIASNSFEKAQNGYLRLKSDISLKYNKI